MSVGDFILLHNETVISVGDLESVKIELSNFLLEDSELDIEEFIIMKRLGVRAGIFIDE